MDEVFGFIGIGGVKLTCPKGHRNRLRLTVRGARCDDCLSADGSAGAEERATFPLPGELVEVILGDVELDVKALRAKLSRCCR